MGRGPRNQSRPIGPDTVGPRAGRASGPRPTLAGARGPRHRLTLAASSAGEAACCLPWAVCSSAPAHSRPSCRGLPPAPAAPSRALVRSPPRHASASEAGQTMSLSVYQCEGPCLRRPAPRRPAPTRGIGPAGHRKRPPRLGRCAGARRHLPNRLSDPASVQAQTGAGLRSRRGRHRQTPPDGPRCATTCSVPSWG